MLVPNYDPLACSLMCAAFEHAGYQARLIEESPVTVASSLRLNDGQCLPVSAIVQGAVETIRRYHLDPANTALFLNAVVRTACNLPQYPLMAARLLQQQGDGFEAMQVFAASSNLIGLPLELIYDVYCGYLLGGLVRRIGCRLRPYELVPGQTNRLIEDARQRLYDRIAAGGSKEDAFQAIVADFRRIPVRDGRRRPKVAIIGDLYVRDNDVFNQALVADLEAFGAEVVTTPLNFLLRLSLGKDSQQMKEDGRYLLVLRDRLVQELLDLVERRFYAIAGDLLEEGYPAVDGSVVERLQRYHLTASHLGETAQNVLKVYSLLQHFPDLALIVHANPIFCCPGLVSEAIFKAVEADIGIPIVSLVYDGAATSKNDALAPYLHYIVQA
jgi:predicted nucleotide-binding protein (sugar kinase/HSP70/actin superfamily)